MAHSRASSQDVESCEHISFCAQGAQHNVMLYKIRKTTIYETSNKEEISKTTITYSTTQKSNKERNSLQKKKSAKEFAKQCLK